jgi:phosphoribosylformimino-5-aminoimidazole carboxamide ribotide isomerase
VVVGVDVKEGRVAVRGWTEGYAASPPAFGKKWAAAGVRSFVYTEISRDGVMTGVDLEATEGFARATGGKVIASGGVGSLDHLRALETIASAGIEGVIIGRALYEKAFTLAEAQSVVGDMELTRAERARPGGSGRAEGAGPRESGRPPRAKSEGSEPSEERGEH